MLNTLKCNDFIWHKWHKKRCTSVGR
jgi:hypothetical protein